MREVFCRGYVDPMILMAVFLDVSERPYIDHSALKSATRAVKIKTIFFLRL